MMFDITPHQEYIKRRISDGASMRMLEKEIGVSRKTLSRAMKRCGMRVPTKDESLSHIWENHKHPRLGMKGTLCPVYGRHLSDETKEKLRKANTAANNYHWSGGRKIHSEGYVLVYDPESHLCNKHGFVMEHRLVAEKKYGRELTTNDIVHHLDGNKQNNDPDNIVVLTRAEHIKIHRDLLNQSRRKENA